MIHHRIIAMVYAENPLPQNTKPQVDNLPLGKSLSNILGWSLYLALFACGIAAIISGGFIAFGRVSGRPQQFDRGMTGFIVSLSGAFVVGIAIPLVNAFYNLPSL